MTTPPAPGSAAWLKFMTASKIAAVVGTSPYESRFSLWHKMAGNVPSEEDKPVFEYGHVIEPALINWFISKHPDLSVVKDGRFWTHEEHTWAGATPDAVVVDDAGRTPAVVEAKTARLAWEWADGVPPGYADQCQWEMWVTGARVAYVAADVSMELKEYEVPFDADRVAFLVYEAERFMASLKAGEAPSLTDGSTQTYTAIRHLHPEIDPESFEVSDALAFAYLDAHYDKESAERRFSEAKNQVFNDMGTAQYATWNGDTILRRQARGEGKPFAVTPKNLPERTAA